MTSNPLRIHSVAEAYLVLMVTPCESCGKGPLQASHHEAVALPQAAGRRLTAKCQSCEHEQVFVFDLSDAGDLDAQAQRDLPVINPSSEPSRVIDLAQWLMLFETIVRAAGQQADAAESRRLGYEAAQCLEEALKFYPAGDTEWPEESAFFSEATLDRYRRHQHRFARTRLVDLRRKLPTLTQMELRLGGQKGQVVPDTGSSQEQPRKRRWWAFWR